MKLSGFIDPGGWQHPPAFAPGVAVRASMEIVVDYTVRMSPEQFEKLLAMVAERLEAVIKHKWNYLEADLAGRLTDDLRKWNSQIDNLYLKNPEFNRKAVAAIDDALASIQIEKTIKARERIAKKKRMAAKAKKKPRKK